MSRVYARLKHSLLALTAGLLLSGCGIGGPTATAPAAASTAPTGATAPSGTPAAGLALAPCQLATPGTAARLAALCGTLLVYEDRTANTGRQISLRVAVLRATGRSPAPEPLFFLAGGPGQAATETFILLQQAFEKINQQHDIVLVDQRGTGGSNPLRCPPTHAALEIDTLDEVRAAADACLPKLAGDPRFYTTSPAIDDLDQVRAALGYDRVNLYGVSYGTRAALSYLRQYQARVRSLILDGVVPADEPLGLHVAGDAQHALDLAFDRCAAEPDCQAAFPNLRDDFAAVAGRLRQAPVPLTLNHPRTGEFIKLDFTYALFAGAVRLLTYAPETVALLPLLIHSARVEEDYRLLAAEALLVSDQLSESISLGMNAAVLCSEDAPGITPAAAEAANAGTYLGSSQTDQLMALCADWPRGVAPPGFKDPVTSDAPVLLLSGAADPVTPPENAERAARTLPNGLSLIAPGQGHNVILRGCLPELAARFVDAGSAQGLETTCVGQIAPLPFFITFAGTGP